jgi:hypothetical protein
MKTSTRTREERNAIALQRYHQKYKHDPKYLERSRKRAKQQHLEVGTQWYHENKEHASTLNKVWREEHKKEFQQYTTNWRRNNLDKLTKNAAAYRAQKIKATPKWANENIIQKFYTKANNLTKNTGIQHTVDHIVPLTSKKVCGLHCEANLQILTLSENSSKKHLHWPDMPNV